MSYAFGNNVQISEMRSAYGETLVRLGGENPNVVCVGGDTTDSLKTKIFGEKFCGENFWEKNFWEKIFGN